MRYSTSKVPCTLIGTGGLEILSSAVYNGDAHLGQIKRMGELYTRFKPQRREVDLRSVPLPNRPGDIPGSRTYVAPDQITPKVWRPEDKVTQTISVDSHCLFTQLETVAFLGKRDSTRGIFPSFMTVCDGTIRVWRDWLSKRCEQKRWTDGELIEVHRDEPIAPELRGSVTFENHLGSLEPPKDPTVLWTSGTQPNVGIKFRVKEQKWQRRNPILFESEIEVPVSYAVEFDGKENVEFASA